jgi:TRAP transporter TAXI family solute receptor
MKYEPRGVVNRVARWDSTSLRLGVQNVEHPWWHLAGWLTEALVGFGRPLLPEARVAVVTPPRLHAARLNPIDVADGLLEAAFTTPSATAAMAAAGTGLYERPYDGLRAIAAYPHDDFLVFAVDAAAGIRSFDDIAGRPLRLVTGRGSDEGEQDVVTYAAEQVLLRHGASYAQLREWGGSVTYAPSPHLGAKLVLEGKADAYFQEAQNAPFWRELATSRDVVFLPVPEPTLAHLESLGFRRAEIPAGHYRGVEEPVPTVDFTGWLLFCREDLPDETAYALARAVDETRPRVEEGDPIVRSPLTLPIDPARLFRETILPLHPGAEAYAREQGYLA